MPYDYTGMAGFGIILGIILYVALTALSLWIFYLIIRTAVKNGILLADRQRSNRF